MKHVTEVLLKPLAIFAAVDAAIVIVIVIVIGSYVDSIPDVHFSNATGTCVKVVSFDENEYTCDGLPEKYNTVWTK